jgi:hypothetical protein
MSAMATAILPPRDTGIGIFAGPISSFPVALFNPNAIRPLPFTLSNLSF